MDKQAQKEFVKYIADGIRVLKTRDSVPISDLQIAERANNIAAILLSMYCVEEPCDEEC